MKDGLDSLRSEIAGRDKIGTPEGSGKCLRTDWCSVLQLTIQRSLLATTVPNIMSTVHSSTSGA